MTGKVVAVVADWGDGFAQLHASKISDFCGIEAIAVRGYDHEPVVLNRMIEEADGDYVWFTDIDDTIIYPDTAHVLATFLDRYPQVGIACPHRSSEPRGANQPYVWYLEDNTCAMYRKSVGAKFDPDFIFTGWNDLDFGEEVKHLGFQVVKYGLISVQKSHTPYGDWSNFRSAYNARNRLLLEAKWYWVGRAKWQGVDHYNELQAEHGKEIPTMFELAWWSEDKLNRFAASIDMEHPQIYELADKGPGNEEWSINNI